MLDHFSHLELACPTTDQLRLAAGFGEALERLPVELDEPIYLNSACRSPLHNAKISGHPHSLHLIVNVIVKEVEATHKPNSQRATDTNLPAEEGQAKEGAWELFSG